MKKRNQRDKMKENWKGIARVWASYVPPTKPSAGEIKFYEKELQKLIKNKKSDLRALVLGATPEFRDLLSKYKVNTVFVDINSDSVKAMTSLLKEPINPNEKLVLSDWLHMPLKKNTYDLVLSDSAQDNIKYSEFKKFFAAVHSFMKTDGVWFFGAVNVSKKDSLSFDQYLNLYKKYPRIFRVDNPKYWLNIFRLCYNPEFYSKKTKIYDFRKLNKKITNLINNKILPKKALKDIGLGVDYQQVVLNKKDFKSLIKNNFKVVKEFRDKSNPEMKIKWTAILKNHKHNL